MIVVSDTTHLRYLVEIGKDHILEKLFSRVIIPQAVAKELQGARTPQKVKDWIAQPPAWLEIKQADTSFFTPQKKIGNGEREALALARQLKADIVLLDDKGALTEAKRNSIPAVRLYPILERAAEEKLLDLPKTLEEMKRTSHRRPPEEEVIKPMLERDQQRKQIEEQSRKQAEEKARQQQPDKSAHKQDDKEQRLLKKVRVREVETDRTDATVFEVSLPSGKTVFLECDPSVAGTKPKKIKKTLTVEDVKLLESLPDGVKITAQQLQQRRHGF